MKNSWVRYKVLLVAKGARVANGLAGLEEIGFLESRMANDSATKDAQVVRDSRSDQNSVRGCVNRDSAFVSSKLQVPAYGREYH